MRIISRPRAHARPRVGCVVCNKRHHRYPTSYSARISVRTRRALEHYLRLRLAEIGLTSTCLDFLTLRDRAKLIRVQYRSKVLHRPLKM